MSTASILNTLTSNANADFGSARSLPPAIYHDAGILELEIERLFREASLGSTDVDAAFLLNRFTDESVSNLFEPLDAHLAGAPIEDFEGISPGMRAALTFDGKLYGIPFRHATEVVLDLPRPDTVTAELFTAAGRRVATLQNGPLPAGRTGVVWDGQDTLGRRAPAGIYFLRVRTSQGVATRKLTRID